MSKQIVLSNMLLRRLGNQISAGNRAKISTSAELLKTANAGEGRVLYSPKLFKKHYEIIPLLALVFGGIFVLTGFIFRNSLTRDDVKFRSGEQFGFEREENLDRARKFLTFNQKYGAPKGLKELYEEMKEE